jgi:hypothetical protein
MRLAQATQKLLRSAFANIIVIFALTGVWVKSFSLQQFVKHFLVAIGLRREEAPVRRNQVIQMRYSTGEGLTDLASAFGLSPQRVYQIVNGKRQ